MYTFNIFFLSFPLPPLSLPLSLSPTSDIHSPIYLAGWIAHRSVRLYVGHPDRYHYLAILGQTPPETMSLKTESGQDQYSFFEEDDEKEVVLSMKEEEEKEELMEGRDEVENVVEEESEKVTDVNE